MNFVDIGLYATYILVAIGIIAIIVFPIIQAIGDPSGLLKSGVGILAILGVFLLAYLISGNEVTPLYEKYEITPTSSKVVGGALITFYLLLIFSFGAIIYSEVSKMFK